MAGAGVTLEDLKKRLAEFAKERDWDQFHSPRNLLLAMVGEVGELSEIFQWKGEVPRGLPNWKDEEKQHLGEELSDVLLYLVRLSDICGVDLGKAALRKLKMNAIKYPANAGSRGSSEKRTEINSDVDNDAGGDCVKGRNIYSYSSTSNGAGSQGSSEKRTQINTDVDNDVGGDCVTGRSIYSDSSTSNGAGSQGSSEKRTQFNTDVHNDAGGD